MGPTLAHRIIQTRKQLPRQRFERVEQLQLVKGVGSKTLEKIRQHLVCN
ncbi:MAG: ComEA family DNA-binding protein [Pirellulaceae bacterium]